MTGLVSQATEGGAQGDEEEESAEEAGEVSGASRGGGGGGGVALTLSGLQEHEQFREHEKQKWKSFTTKVRACVVITTYNAHMHTHSRRRS